VCLDIWPKTRGFRSLILGSVAGTVRSATGQDCDSIARVYNEGISEGRSTFETEPRTAGDIQEWLGAPAHPVLVVEHDSGVVGWARLSPYSPRPCYTGIAEASIYVSAAARGRGLGARLATTLREQAERAGLHKVIGKLLVENEQSRRLAARHSFREVGVHLRHGTIGDEWRDVLVVELLLSDAVG
jgi:L-amino acid N-acyltransferase YncA